MSTACEQAASDFTDYERNEFLSGYGEIDSCCPDITALLHSKVAGQANWPWLHPHWA
jgi:hypothetical protein